MVSDLKPNEIIFEILKEEISESGMAKPKKIRVLINQTV